jgi:hypothetical protein
MLEAAERGAFKRAAIDLHVGGLLGLLRNVFRVPNPSSYRLSHWWGQNRLFLRAVSALRFVPRYA